ncbi:NETI motif-containing protein [Salipaludibacillus daqingensis]|uniref:NETI motif-containing protein n=1 Tax=Salipaludibacillus daqingensis TaxID=3041001 RepID=UPI002473A0F7|nr:NETI motif-containing protein [Salipaludibacillus daqingensis]
MAAKKRKQRFYVEENETIDQCLSRMQKEGFQPVRRMEEPVLKEVKGGKKNDVEVAYQRIVFEGKPIEE